MWLALQGSASLRAIQDHVLQRSALLWPTFACDAHASMLARGGSSMVCDVWSRIRSVSEALEQHSYRAFRAVDSLQSVRHQTSRHACPACECSDTHLENQ